MNPVKTLNEVPTNLKPNTFLPQNIDLFYDNGDKDDDNDIEKK